MIFVELRPLPIIDYLYLTTGANNRPCFYTEVNGDIRNLPGADRETSVCHGKATKKNCEETM